MYTMIWITEEANSLWDSQHFFVLPLIFSYSLICPSINTSQSEISAFPFSDLRF